MSHLRPLVAAAAVLFLLIVAQTASAQDPFTTYRFGQVGPRTFTPDEEGFMNILSYRFPIESEIPWSKSDGGYRLALGSLDMTKLWYDHELRFRGELSSEFSIAVHAVGSADLDSDYVFIQPVLEWHVAEGFEVLFPTSVEFDKGYFNFGLGARWRAPEHGIDYLQLSWIRAGALFGSHKIDPDESSVNDPADCFEFQGMTKIGDLGTSKLNVTWLTFSSFTYDEGAETEEYSGWKAWWIHQVDLSERTPLFFEFTLDRADEALETDEPTVNESEYVGEYEYYQARIELHFNYGREGDAETKERIRTGLEFTYYYSDDELPNDPEETSTLLRSEVTVFGGYRYPFSETFSLDTIVYVMGRNATQRYPNDYEEDGRNEHDFQAKVNFYLRWEINESSFVAITPSFELDSLGWGGGGFQLVYNW
ncbi:MAG: hypothetical protein ABFS86_06330 [Planctomycetota bacterium]